MVEVSKFLLLASLLKEPKLGDFVYFVNMFHVIYVLICYLESFDEVTI